MLTLAHPTPSQSITDPRCVVDRKKIILEVVDVFKADGLEIPRILCYTQMHLLSVGSGASSCSAPPRELSCYHDKDSGGTNKASLRCGS